MTKLNKQFASLFKKYRLRSEIETLAEFGDLLAQEGIVYENSIFTRWQNGDRVPSDRKVLLTIIKLFMRKGGIKTFNEANNLFEVLDMSTLKGNEIKDLPEKDLPISIMQSSLGGLIKDFRNQKNISQIELSYSLGLDNSSMLDSLENGKSKNKPDRKIIDKITSILGLNNIEKNQLLLVGNYLPSQEEIENMRRKIKPILNDWQYPAVLLDFSWRVIDQNYPNIRMYQLDKNLIEYIKNKKPTVLEIIFNNEFLANKYFKGEELKEWKLWLSKVIINYRFSNQSRNKELWYIEKLHNLMKNKLFLEIWSTLDYNSISDVVVTKHGTKFFINPEDKNKRFKMNFFIVPLLEDPRFEIEYYTPSDDISFEYFQNLTQEQPNYE